MSAAAAAAADTYYANESDGAGCSCICACVSGVCLQIFANIMPKVRATIVYADIGVMCGYAYAVYCIPCTHLNRFYLCASVSGTN